MKYLTFERIGRTTLNTRVIREHIRHVQQK